MAGKAKQGKPDAIIALTHIDSDQKGEEITGNAVALAQIKGLDGVLSAHSHRTAAGVVNGMVVVNDFMFTGGDKYDFSKATNVVETYVPIRDCLIDEIKAAKIITPKAPDYIKDISK